MNVLEFFDLHVEHLLAEGPDARAGPLCNPGFVGLSMAFLPLALCRSADVEVSFLRDWPADPEHPLPGQILSHLLGA